MALTAGDASRRIAELETEVTLLREELDRQHVLATRKQAKSRYTARRGAAIARGDWQPYEPADMVREHIRAVMEATGMSRYQFAAAARVHEGTVSKILYTSAERVLTPVARKILRVTTDTPVPDGDWVSPVGSSRRLQALTVAGWSVLLLARRLGVDDGSLRIIRDGGRQRMSAETARRVSELYDQLWNTAPPEGDRAERIAAGKSRSHAARRGWVPGAAWDDDVIDDPGGEPADDWARAPEGRQRRREVLVEEARELFGFGLDREQAAERLGVTREALDKALARTAAEERQG